MNFKERRECLKPIEKYLQEEDCNMESLVGLKVVLSSIMTAIDQRIEKIMKARGKLVNKIKKFDEWID